MYIPDSNHPILLEVDLADCYSMEQMIKRFLKKFKRFKIMDEIREHDYYVKPSDKKRLQRKEGKRKARKQQREYEEKMKDK